MQDEDNCDSQTKTCPKQESCLILLLGLAALGLAGSVAAAAVLTPLLVATPPRPAGNAEKKKL